MNVMIKSDSAGVARSIANRWKFRMPTVEVEYRPLKARSSGRGSQVAVAAHAIAVRRMCKLDDPTMLHVAGGTSRREDLVLLVRGRLMAVEASFIGGGVFEAHHFYAIHHVAVA